MNPHRVAVDVARRERLRRDKRAADHKACQGYGRFPKVHRACWAETLAH